MNGWGQGLMLIDPGGRVMPCHAAGVIPGLEFQNVQQHSLRSIWEESDVFQKFRGDEWMQEPCRSCERKEVDFGGCRCQAMLLTGDARATDPTCTKSPDRHLVDAIIGAVAHSSLPAQTTDWIYRIIPAG
jgi:pyrroloquinoline quinone biosynthesis protein E